MQLIRRCEEMWTRNAANINEITGSKSGGQGVYVLYDGSTPVYVGKGNIRQRVKAAHRSKRRKRWDYFSWYVLKKDKALIHDIEALLLRLLPQHLRILTRRGGHFTRRDKLRPKNKQPIYIAREP